MELLIGAGSARIKQLCDEGRREWRSPITLDINPDHKPDVVWDLNKRPLPFKDDTFDEIHAYDVLEHLGRQGDFKSFFEEWTEWWRILKPGGFLFGISPAADSAWAWGDPGHTRIISPESLTFLVQTEYKRQIGHSPMTDYRFCYRADFDAVYREKRGHAFLYAMKAVKPSRVDA